MAKARVSKGFFGCNTARVDEYLRSLGVDLTSRISAAERELEALVRTREETVQRLAGKMEEVEDYRRKASAYAGLAGKGEAIASSVLEAARYKSECIRAAADRYVEEREMYLLTLDRNIADARSQIADLLKQIRTVAEASARRADEAAPSKVVGHVLSASDDNAPFTVTGSRGFLEVDMSTQSIKVLSQDGEAIGSLRRLVLDRAKERVRGYEIEPLGQGGPLALPAVVPSQAVVGLKRGAIIVRNSWLNEISRSLDGSEQRAEAPAIDTRAEGLRTAEATVVALLEARRAADGSEAGEVQEIPPAAQVEPAAQTESVAQAEPAAQVEPAAQAEPVARTEPAAQVAPEEPPAAEATAAPAAEALPDVEKDVAARRVKYLVGRIVGMDILDADGSLVVSKGSVITAGIVEKARGVGKLAELIVNMTLPGIDPGEESATG